MTNEEIIGIPGDIADRFNRSPMRWRWVKLPDGRRATEVTLEHEAGRVTCLNFKIETPGRPRDPGDDVTKEYFFECLCDVLRRDREIRRKRARRGAETSRRRRESLDYRLAKEILQQRFKPRDHCARCGRALHDEQSLRRGIGPECWDGMMRLMQEILKEQQGGAK